MIKPILSSNEKKASLACSITIIICKVMNAYLYERRTGLHIYDRILLPGL